MGKKKSNKALHNSLDSAMKTVMAYGGSVNYPNTASPVANNSGKMAAGGNINQAKAEQMGSMMPLADSAADPSNMNIRPGGQNEGVASYKGKSHEKGGIPIGDDIEVEDGEFKYDDMIFSNRVQMNDKGDTFAKAAKKIYSKYGDRLSTHDGKATKAAERELGSLFDQQELVKQEMMAKFMPQDGATPKGVPQENAGDNKMLQDNGRDKHILGSLIGMVQSSTGAIVDEVDKMENERDKKNYLSDHKFKNAAGMDARISKAFDADTQLRANKIYDGRRSELGAATGAVVGSSATIMDNAKGKTGTVPDESSKETMSAVGQGIGSMFGGSMGGGAGAAGGVAGGAVSEPTKKALGGKMALGGGDPVDPEDTLIDNDIKRGKSDANVNEFMNGRLTPMPVDAEKYPLISQHEFQYNKDGNRVLNDQSAVFLERQRRLEQNNDFRRELAKKYNYPVNEDGLPDNTKMGSDFVVTPEQLSAMNPDQLESYYSNLEWEDQFRTASGMTQTNRFGANEEAGDYRATAFGQRMISDGDYPNEEEPVQVPSGTKFSQSGIIQGPNKDWRGGDYYLDNGQKISMGSANTGAAKQKYNKTYPKGSDGNIYVPNMDLPLAERQANEKKFIDNSVTVDGNYTPGDSDPKIDINAGISTDAKNAAYKKYLREKGQNQLDEFNSNKGKDNSAVNQSAPIPKADDLNVAAPTLGTPVEQETFSTGGRMKNYNGGYVDPDVYDEIAAGAKGIDIGALAEEDKTTADYKDFNNQDPHYNDPGYGVQDNTISTPEAIAQSIALSQEKVADDEGDDEGGFATKLVEMLKNNSSSTTGGDLAKIGLVGANAIRNAQLNEEPTKNTPFFKSEMARTADFRNADAYNKIEGQGRAIINSLQSSGNISGGSMRKNLLANNLNMAKAKSGVAASDGEMNMQKELRRAYHNESIKGGNVDELKRADENDRADASAHIDSKRSDINNATNNFLGIINEAQNRKKVRNTSGIEYDHNGEKKR